MLAGGDHVLIVLRLARRMAGATAVCLIVMVASCAGVWAQLGPEAPMLAHSTLTPFGLDAPDVVEIGPFTVNPAANVGLGDLGLRGALELDLGWLDFAEGPSVTSIIATTAWAGADGYWKLARYEFTSDAAPLPRLFPTDLLAEFSGDTWVLSYGRQDGDVRWGASWSPRNATQTRLLYAAEGALVPVAQGEAKSTFSGRLGVQVPISDTLTAGAAYTYENNETSFTASPALLGPASGWARAGGEYESRVETMGLAWRPMMGTTVALDYQHGSIRGPNVSEPINIWYLGVEQFLSPKLVVKLTNIDDAWGLGCNYYTSKGPGLGIAFSPSGFRRTRDYLGTCDVLYIWFLEMW